HAPGDPGAEAGTGQHQRAPRGRVARQGLQSPQARRYVAQFADVAFRIEVGVVGPLVAPAKALGNLGQRGDLRGVRAALETVGKNAVPALVHARMLASPDADQVPSARS